MSEIYIIFLTSYNESMLKQYKISINGQKQTEFHQIEKGNQKIFVNAIKLNKDNINNGIIIDIEYDKTKTNSYKMNINYEKEKIIYFLFDYKLQCLKKDMQYINWKFCFFLMNEQKYINEKFSFTDKFSFFFNYLLETKSDVFNKENIKFYMELVDIFHKYYPSNYIFADTLPIDVAISILIIYNQRLNVFIKIIDKKKFIYNYNEFINIKNFNDIYLNGITKCLEKLKSELNKTALTTPILEIIMIYFIQYRAKDLSIILLPNYKEMFLSIFKQEKLNYLTESKSLLDKDIFNTIITNILDVNSIEKFLKLNSNDNVTYLNKINENFDVIFSVVEKLESLKEVFKIDFEVSQGDNLKQFVKSHNELLTKQKNKKKFFLSFIKIIQRYYSLFEKYENLTYFCELLTMVEFEAELFPKITKIQDLKIGIASKIRDLLKNKMEISQIQSDDVIKVLVKLKNAFHDENIFKLPFKEYIGKYFIEKRNEPEIMRNFLENKISELFSNKKEPNIIVKLLSEDNSDFDLKSNWISLLPDKPNEKDQTIIANLINKIIQDYDNKNKEANFEDNFGDNQNYFFFNLFFRKKYKNIFDNIIVNEKTNSILIGIIISYLKRYNNNEEAKEEILNFLEQKFFKKNIFFIEKNNEKECIPIIILDIINSKKKFINILSNYVINKDFNENRVLLLKEMHKNTNYYNYDYKKKTISFISELEQNKTNFTLDEFIYIYNKVDEIKNVFLKPGSINDYIDGFFGLQSFKREEIADFSIKLEQLKNILKCLEKLFSDDPNILRIENLINDLKRIKLIYYINKYYKKDDTEIERFLNEYKEIREKFLVYIHSQLFLDLINSDKIINIKNKEEKIEKYEEAKNLINELMSVLFQENFKDLKDFKEDYFKLFQKNKKEKEIRVQIGKLYEIYICINHLPIDVLSEERKNKIVNKIELFTILTKKIKIIKGLFHLLENIDASKSDFYEQLKDKYDYFNSADNKDEIPIKNSKADEWLQNNNLKDRIIIERQEENNVITIQEIKDSYKLIELLSENPDAIKWLLEMKEEELESIINFLIYSDYNQYINLFDIKKIREYFNTMKGKNDSELIIEIIDKMNGNSHEKENINYFVETYPTLKKYNSKMKGEQIDVSGLLNKLDNSKFYLKFNNEKQIYELSSIIYKNKELINDYKKLIIEKGFFAISRSMNFIQIYDKLKKKIEINNYINEYLSIINSKNNSWKQNTKNIELNIKNMKEFIDSMKKEEEDEKKILYEYYENKSRLRFFSGIQLNMLMKLLKDKNYSEIRNLFSPFINNQIKISFFNLIRINLNGGNYFEPEEDIKREIMKNNLLYQKKLEIISNYLENIIEDSDQIFEKNKIEEKYRKIITNTNIYIKSFSNEDYEEDILNIFYKLTGNLPLLSNIFIFDEKSIEQEFMPFLYRIIKTNLYCLFILVMKPCKNENEDNLLKKINELILNNNRKSAFILLYSDSDKYHIDKIEKYIKNYKPYTYDINYVKVIKNNIKEILKGRIELVYSDFSGVGKTTYILNFAKEKNYKYIYFPIKSHYDKNKLINHLKEEIIIDIDYNNNILLHIDLHDSLNESLIKEFLFYFIFFKFYGKDNNFFNYAIYKYNYIKKIMIELPNTYKNYFNKYKILNYINEIKVNNNFQIKEEANIKKIGDSKIQIVSNILKESIESKNIDLESKILLKEKDFNKIIFSALNEINNNNNNENRKYNLYQIMNLIKFLSTEFTIFTNCFNLEPTLIFSEYVPNYFKKLRQNIINSFLLNSKHVIGLDGLENLENELYKKKKKILNENQGEKNYDEIMSQIQEEKSRKILDYDKIEPSLIGMQNNKLFLSIISSSKNSEIINEINDLINQINKENKKQKLEKIKNPIELKDDEFLRELLKLIIIEDDLIISEEEKIEEIQKAIKSNFDDYVFTFDNFFKLALIFLRIRAGIPTILMGETGCGKTYLLKMFSLIYGQNSNCMYTLSFHAGITDDDIIEFIQKTINEVKKDEDNLINTINRSMDSKDYMKNFKISEENHYKTLWFFQKWFFTSKYEKNYNEYKDDFFEKKIRNRKVIIFLDEVNTSYALGMIKRIICDKNFRKKFKIPDRFIIICACNPYRALKEEYQNLQFGLSMRYKNTRKLVYTVNPLPYSLLNFIFYFGDLSEETTKKYIQKMISKIKCAISDKHRNFIIDSIMKSHFFIKNKGDISSVSLREINRFKIFYIFFYEVYFNKYRKLDLQKNELENKALILSLYFCYYLRLPTNELKQEYIQVNNIPDFINVKEVESIFITGKVLEGIKGYSKNIALCENIFSEFICILNRIPLIICGKPGSSKTLSVRLLLNVMKGKDSHISFFKQFPAVSPSFYQCSLTSTSENLEILFKEAENKLKKNKYKIISLVFMDEMGIADESENNPLKVLHSKLDGNSYDNKMLNEKFAFIGLSNWTLDASKINRTIYSVVPAPDEEYLTKTEREISRVFDDNLQIEYPLGNIYLKYIDEQKKINKEDFHGFRDFYDLIKYICYNKINNNNINNELNYVLKGIYRNFGGFIDSSKNCSEEIFKRIFLEEYGIQNLNIEYNILNRIKDNLESINSRYLLLISDDDQLEEVKEVMLKYCLKDKNYRILSDEDLNKYDNKENGILNLLLTIQVLMKKELILILKNLEILYPSLYELFNKNFDQYVSGKKFVRISYESKHSYVEVNDKFKVIVLVSKNKLNEEQKPFLNRFEKQIFSVQNIFKDKLDIINKYYDYIQNYNSILQKYIEGNSYNYIHEFLLYIFMAENNLEKFLEKIIPLFSWDMIYWLNHKIDLENRQIINNIYKNYYRNNYNLITCLANIQSYKNVIYTYSDVNQQLLNFDNIINNRNLNINFETEKKIILDLNKDEEEIKYLINDENYNLYLIPLYENKIMNSTGEKLNDMEKHFNNINNNNGRNKVFIYILYKKRCEKEINQIKSEKKENKLNKILGKFLYYNQIFIENLFINYNNNEIYITREEIINIAFENKEELLNKAFYLINFPNNEGKEKIKNKLKENNEVLNIIKAKIISIIKNYNIEKELTEIIYHIKNDQNFIRCFYLYIKEKILICLKNIIIYLLNEQVLSTILFIEVNRNSDIYNDLEILDLLLSKFNESKNYEMKEHIHFRFNLILFNEYEKLYETIKAKKNIKEEIICNDNYNFKRILDSNDENLKKDLYNDYIIYIILEIFKLNEPREKLDKILAFMNIILNRIIQNSENDSRIYFERMSLFLYEQETFLNILIKFISIEINFIDRFNEYINEYINNNANNYNNNANNANNNLCLILESFLECITNKKNFSYYFKPEKEEVKEAYINVLKIIDNNIKKFEKLITENIFKLLIIIKIFLYVAEKDNNNLQTIHDLVIKNIDEFNIGWDKILHYNNKILFEILLIQCRNEDNNYNNLKTLIRIFSSNEIYMDYSFLFFNNIFYEFINVDSLNNENSNENFINVPNEIEHEINNILSNNNNKELIKENLIFYFESLYENFYFEKIINKNNDKDERNKKILLGRNKNLIIAYLNDMNNLEQNNINIKEISKISFIKVYFRYFANIFYEYNKGNMIIKFKDLMEEKFYLSSQNLNPLREYIVKYILNNLKIKFNNNINDLNNFINNISYLQNYIDNINDNSFISLQVKYIPNIEELIGKFKSKNDNEKKNFPILNYFINHNDKIEYLKQLTNINSITKRVIDALNNNQINPEDQVNKIVQNVDELKNYIKSYNYLLQLDNLKEKNLYLSEENCEIIQIKKFLIKDNNANNQLKNIFNNFINYQNDFIDKVKEKHFPNEKFENRKIDIQIARKENTFQFNLGDDEFLKIFLNNCSIIDKNQKLEIKFDGIEDDLVNSLRPELKIFSENEYQNDDDILKEMNLNK